jgi:hypothetical protein
LAAVIGRARLHRRHSAQQQIPLLSRHAFARPRLRSE